MIRRTLAAAAALLVLSAARPIRAQSDYSFVVVVNTANPTSALPRSAVAQLFLKRAAWADGQRALPVDQPEESRTRRDFTQLVHRKSVMAIRSYWQQQIFSGREVPPPEKKSDQEVLQFVRTNPNAIGYVSASADLGDGVKILNLTSQ
jgi:ABC-type phosphate transport system substrate-binding protein